jgi:prevent-host-death family protein
MERILLVGLPQHRPALEQARFEVVRRAKPFRLLDPEGIDLVVLDLPEPGALAALDQLRKDGIRLPVIIVAEVPSAKFLGRAAKQNGLVCRAAVLADTVERSFGRRPAGRVTYEARQPTYEAGQPSYEARQPSTPEARPALLPFRNRRGEQVQVPSYAATVAKNEFARVLDVALERGAVAITRHDSPRAVLLSVDEYNALVGAQRSELDTLTGEFDALASAMQTASARRGVRAAFDASPAELGKAAVTAARKRG